MKLQGLQNNISLCQRKYTLKIIDDSCLLVAKPSKTSMDGNLWLNGSDGALLGDPCSYQISGLSLIPYHHLTGYLFCY